MPDVELRPLPPEAAIEYFKSKGYAVSFDWRDVWREEHARAFTVAKGMTPELLQTIREAVDKALAEGQTVEMFIKGLRPLLEAQGWWGRQKVVDPLTGEAVLAQLGSPRRLQLIYEMNLRSAYQAGRWERIQTTKAALPFLRYTAIMDGRTRPQHRAWHGTVLPADDPWWDTHYPPCGWRCRCTVIQFNERTMRRRGWEVTERPVAFQQVPFENPRTGQRGTVEQGIDPGFDFNVGKAYLDGLAPRPAPGEGAAANATRTDRGDHVAGFLAVFGLAPDATRVFTDPLGFGIAVGPAMFRNPDGSDAQFDDRVLEDLVNVGYALERPAEIRAAWIEGEDGRPILARRYIGDGVALEIYARSWRPIVGVDQVAAIANAGRRLWAAGV